MLALTHTHKLMSKTAIDEKKLERLRSQLFGKTPSQQKVNTTQEGSDRHLPNIFKSSSLNTAPTALLNDTSYLKKDLFKISILTTLALLAQLSLYFGIKNHLIKLPI
jgi:hypothetical protein